MSKLNLFTLFIVVISVVIAAEFLVNDYYDYPQKKANDVQSNLLEQNTEDKVESNVIDFDAGSIGNDNDEGNLIDNDASVKAFIAFEVVEKSGMQNVTLQRMPFNGLLFNFIDIKDYKSTPVVYQRLLQKNKDEIGGFYEFHTDQSILANEVFLLIKERANKVLGISINDTNQYGEKSFFVNYEDKPNIAFLVVKINNSVYALSYQKDLHTYIKSIIQFITS